MSINRPYICLSTKLIYSSIIVVLLSAIFFTLFPLNEIFQKREVANNAPIVNPTHVPPTDEPTPSPIQKVLFPSNPEAEKGMRDLKKSKYGHPSYVLDIEDENRPLFDGINGNSGNAIHYLKYLGSDMSNSHLLKYKVTYAMYPLSSSLTEEFHVNIELNEVKPLFPSMDIIDSILNPVLKKVQIPNTNKSLMLPSHFIIKSEDKTLSFSQPRSADMIEFCSKTLEYPYCKDYSQYLGDKLYTIGNNRSLGVNIRLIEWIGTPHEWALDNVSWQGSTYRETIRKYPDFIGSETATIGNNDFYKIGEGCCGDRSYSYITKGFGDSGTPLLIIIRATGKQVQIEEKDGIRRMPYLEEILKTMN